MLKARAYSGLLRVAKETAWEWSWKSHRSLAAEMFFCCRNTQGCYWQRQKLVQPLMGDVVTKWQR